MTATSDTIALAHEDSRGNGRLMVLLPGAGDLRSEHRFLADKLASAGFRVVTADLPGHGESPPAPEYTVASAAAAIVELVESLQAGPAVVVACSFAPAAAVWAAAERPELFAGIVAISPHLHAEDSFKAKMQEIALDVLLRGPWAAGMWARFYRSWYKTDIPADLDQELVRLRQMFSDPARRRAARETLTADRDGVRERVKRLDLPTLAVFGSLDDHFDDPALMAENTAAELRGDRLVVEGAGHYPHVEQPETVASAIVAFAEGLS
jgi:pimeloyl-ACP methyl ester carboxylesterase